jgi:hypothetical protein
MIGIGVGEAKCGERRGIEVGKAMVESEREVNSKIGSERGGLRGKQ